MSSVAHDQLMQMNGVCALPCCDARLAGFKFFHVYVKVHRERERERERERGKLV